MGFPDRWDVVPFGQAFSDLTGGNAKIKTSDYARAGRLPIVDQGQDFISGYIDDTSLQCKIDGPCIVFGDHTKCMKYIDFPFALGADGIKVLRPTDALDARFAYWFLAHVQLPDDVGYSRHFKFLKRVKVPLPPIDEQRRLAAILDHADAVRRKRQEALLLTDQLLRSTFLEMFGDPATNPKRWSTQSLGTMIASIEPGWSATGGARPRRDGEWGVLKVSAVSTGRYQPSENKLVPQLESGKAIIVPSRGDLLFSRANTRDLVAAVCLVEQETPNVFLPDKLWRITATDRACNEFLFMLLQHPKIQSAIAQVATGTSGSMLNVSQDKVRSMEVIAPPTELQARFRDHYWILAEHRMHADASKHAADALFASLTHRAFTGQL